MPVSVSSIFFSSLIVYLMANLNTFANFYVPNSRRFFEAPTDFSIMAFVIGERLIVSDGVILFDNNDAKCSSPFEISNPALAKPWANVFDASNRPDYDDF